MTITKTAEDVSKSFDSPVPIGSKYLEKMLGWVAKNTAPPRTAAQIYDWIDPLNDEYIVSLSQLEKVLLQHPAYILLEPKDKSLPKGFIPRKTLIESACGYLLRWCSHDDSEGPIPDTLGERICRLIASPYQLEVDDLWTILEQVGMIEKLGDGNISVAYTHTFLSFCQYWGLQAEVVLSWDNFQARAQYQILKPVHLDFDYDDYWLSQFDDDERTLIERRLLDGDTLEELGQLLGVSRERARQRLKKLIERLQHPAFRKIFGYVLGQTLFELSSMRLVHPDGIAKKMEDYFRRQITSRGLYQILKTIAMVEPIQVYDSDWLWVNWGKGTGKPPLLESWEDKHKINKEDYLSVAANTYAGGLSKTEGDILFQCAEENHRSPKLPKTCIIRTLNALKYPAHVKVIKAKAHELFPIFSRELSTSRINSVLQNLEKSVQVIKIDQAVYSLPEYAEEEILQNPPEPRLEISSSPWRDGIVDYDTILAEVESEGERHRNIFSELDPKDLRAVHEAILRIVKAVEDLPKPRSLCELRITQESYSNPE